MAHRCAAVIFILVSALLLIRCTPPVTTKPAVEPIPGQPIRLIRGDTLVYQIAFPDTLERNRFSDAFGRFLREQNFSVERFDSAGVYAFFKILPSVKPAMLPEPAGSQEAVGPVPPDTVLSGTPSPGGSLRLFYPRGSIDYPCATLVDAYPFGEITGSDSSVGYFTVVNSSASAVTLKLARKITNSTGKIMNVLDFIELWTRHIREHPAEGLAIFRFCDGLAEYLHGQEAIVRGFSAIDNSTLRIRLSTPDPQALERLQSPRTLPAIFGLGSYFVKTNHREGAAPGKDRVLSAAGNGAFVNEVTIRCGGDQNPLLSFSLGRYDAVFLWSASDIDYGRRNLLKNGSCSLVGRDRYFIACALQDSVARACIRTLVSGQELLRNFVKAEGSAIGALESDTFALPAQPPVSTAPASPREPLTILFRKDDAVSKIIAEKLLAAVTHAGLTGTLTASDEKSYETALVSRSYGCAVAWVPEGLIFSRPSEKLRLASIFFNDETDEFKRLRENREIPLFSIDWYLLAKSKVGLYKGSLHGIYVKQENRQ